MKVQLITTIGDKRIIRAIEDAAYDVEATRKQIAPMLTPGMTKPEIDQLFMANVVYAKPGPEGELIGDAAANVVREKLNAKGPHRALLDTGAYIDDYRGVEYWIKESGQWLKGVIEQIGATLPAGAVLQNDLTEEQRQEVAEQQEAERVAALTPEQRIAEIKARLAEIDRLDGPRPIREAVKDMAESAGLDTSRLMQHEDEAIALREQLAAITAG
jgi:hypothetical protein